MIRFLKYHVYVYAPVHIIYWFQKTEFEKPGPGSGLEKLEYANQSTIKT